MAQKIKNHRPPTWVLIQVLASLLQTQLIPKASTKIAKGSPSARYSAPHVKNWMRLPALTWPHPDRCSYLGNKPGRKPHSFLTAFHAKINKWSDDLLKWAELGHTPTGDCEAIFQDNPDRASFPGHPPSVRIYWAHRSWLGFQLLPTPPLPISRGKGLFIKHLGKTVDGVSA